MPDDLPRFIEVGSNGARVAIEDAILHFLPTVVAGDEIGHTVFRITRDADFSVSGDADDLLEAVETQLLRRRFGDVVRLEVAAAAPTLLVDLLRHQLHIDAAQVYTQRAPLGLREVGQLFEIDRPDLKDKPWKAITRRPFMKKSPAELLGQIRRRDVLVHHPYDSFDASVGAFAKAALDPKVGAFKATVYRTDDSSPTLSSLVQTAEKGKQAVCLVELKARFDERRNIEWSRALEQAGVDIVYGVPDLKIHAKLALLVRHEQNGLRRYVHIGTGNYHSSNASTYEDLGLFTADPDIAADVADVFNAVTGLSRPAVFRKLLVGPWFLRDGILQEIERVSAAARAGEPARIRLKVNSLVDEEIIEALYAASSAGVAVDIVTRGICCLRPGIAGLSDNITVRSVLGRFLEHSRILSFQTGDKVSVWIGSADLMPRNLDRRIEVMTPIEDSRLRIEIGVVLDALMADTRFSWTLSSDGAWHRTSPAKGRRAVSAQEALMKRAEGRAKKAASPAKRRSRPARRAARPRAGRRRRPGAARPRAPGPPSGSAPPRAAAARGAGRLHRPGRSRRASPPRAGRERRRAHSTRVTGRPVCAGRARSRRRRAPRTRGAARSRRRPRRPRRVRHRSAPPPVARPAAAGSSAGAHPGRPT